MVVNNAAADAITPSQAASQRRARRASKTSKKPVKNIACPSCREKGRDSTGNHMMVFDDGAGYCTRCPKRFTKEEVDASVASSPRKRYAKNTSYQSQYVPKLTLEDIAHYGFIGEKKRGITSSTDQRFGVRTEVSTSNGVALNRYYPYRSENDLMGYKVREMPKEWKQAIGTIKGTDLFGWHLCEGKKRVLIITEGEEDCLAGYQMNITMNKRAESRRVRKSVPHIVSLPNGAKGAVAALLQHIDEIQDYERVFWFGDNYKKDPEGLLALEAAVQVIGVDKLFVAEYPEKCKDLCDVLKLGGDDAIDAFADMYFSVQKYQPADIVSGKDMTLEQIEREVVKGIPLPFLPTVDDKQQGIRLHEHTLLFSGSGMGKTTLCRAIGHYLCDTEGWLVGNIYLEEKKDKTSQGYIAYHNSVALNEYRKDFNSIPLEGRIEAKEKVIDNMFFLDHNGCIQPDVLMNKIRYLYNRGCKLIILDHISMVVTGSDDERKDIDYLMEKIYQFCENYPVHVLSVVHLNRGTGKVNFERGGEISSQNLRGSSGLLQLAWNALAVEGDNQHEEHPDVRFMRWLKVRETGDVGLCKGGYQYSKKTGRFTYNGSITRDDIAPKQQSYGDSKPSMGGKGNGYNNSAS